MKKLTMTLAVAGALASMPVFAAEIGIVKGDDAGTYKLQGSNTSVGLYGFVHLDVIKNFQQDGGWAYDSGAVGGRKGVMQMTAESSRIGFKSVTNADIGTIRTKVEGDFAFGNKFRLRHAYGEIKSGNNTYLAGKTWDLFADLDAAPETLDFGGPAGIALNRPEQLRFTTETGAGTLAAALQMPANSLAKAGDDPITKYPALTGAWSMTGKTTYLALHGLINPVTNEPAGRSSETKYGYGLNLGATAKLGAKDTLLLTLTHGKGISQYVGGANYNFETVDASGDVVLTKVSAVTLGLARVWNDKVRSNVSYSYVKLGDEFGGSTANDKVSNAYINTIWTVASNTELGLEYMYGNRKLNDGTTGGIASRIQGSFHYNF